MNSDPNKLPLLFSSLAGRELNYFSEIIYDTFIELEPMRWTTKTGEIGFYEKDKKNKREAFFGMWFEVWEKYGLPFCLSIDVPLNERSAKYPLIQKYVVASTDKGLKYIEYDGYAIVLFEWKYFNHDNDAERLVKLFIELSTLAGLNPDFRR
jgi:hypothetical protein